MINDELYKKVVEWGKEKGILVPDALGSKQAMKTCEEATELLMAASAADQVKELYKRGDIDSGVAMTVMRKPMLDVKDALGDVLVTLIMCASIYRMSLNECLEIAYNVISKRTGKMVKGVFVKDE